MSRQATMTTAARCRIDRNRALADSGSLATDAGPSVNRLAPDPDVPQRLLVGQSGFLALSGTARLGHAERVGRLSCLGMRVATWQRRAGGDPGQRSGEQQPSGAWADQGTTSVIPGTRASGSASTWRLAS
jgi:hypothetical protein